MRLVKLAASAAGLVAVFLMILLATMHFGAWSPSYADVKTRYAGSPSRFIRVGEVSLHVRDEGRGPILVLLHSSMTNLREWDAWTNRLRSRYRVIRFDWPPYGLSVDPSGRFSMNDAEAILERFVDQEHLARFTLVGSSSGAMICVLYAAKHPERVDALALSALPLAAPPPTRTDPRVKDLIWLHKTFFPNYFPKIYYRLFLRGLFADPAKVTSALVDWYWASNTLPGAQARIAAYNKADAGTIWKKTGKADAAKITAPVLLQWGDADPVLPAAVGDSAKAYLSHAEVTLIHYPDAGHYPMLEIPEKTAADLERFLADVYPAKP